MSDYKHNMQWGALRGPGVNLPVRMSYKRLFLRIVEVLTFVALIWYAASLHMRIAHVSQVQVDSAIVSLIDSLLLEDLTAKTPPFFFSSEVKNLLKTLGQDKPLLVSSIGVLDSKVDVIAKETDPAKKIVDVRSFLKTFRSVIN